MTGPTPCSLRTLNKEGLLFLSASIIMPRAVSVGSSKPVPKRKKPRKSLRQMVKEAYSNVLRHSGHNNNSNSSAGGVTATSKKKKKPLGYNLNNSTHWFQEMRKRRKRAEKRQQAQNNQFIVVNGYRRYGATSRAGSPKNSASTGGTWRQSGAK